MRHHHSGYRRHRLRKRARRPLCRDQTSKKSHWRLRRNCHRLRKQEWSEFLRWCLAGVTMGGFGPIAPNAERGVVNAFSRVAAGGPRGSLLDPRGGSNKHGGSNGVAIHCVNNNGGRVCHGVSFGHAGSNVTTAMGAVRCSPGHATHVTLLMCTSNRGDCVVTPGKLRIKRAIMDNTNITPRIKGALFLDRVPLNAIVRGVRLCPNRKTTVTHSTNSCTRLLTHRNGFTVVGLPSNRAHVMLMAYHTAINIISGVSRDLRDSNGTNHRH